MVETVYTTPTGAKLLKNGYGMLFSSNMDEIKRIASSVPGALEIHVIRTRTSGNQLFVDMHLLVDPNMTVLEGHRIATEIKKRLLQNNTLFIRDVVVHIEP